MEKYWEKIKKWAKKTALPWLKKGWLQIVNVLVVFIAYGTLDNLGSGVAYLVGLWGFVLLVYWIFWKLFGLDKLIAKKIAQKKEKKEKKK